MLLRASPLGPGLTFGGAIALAMVAAAGVVSVASFSKAMGAEYRIEPNRAGILLSGLGLFGYVLATPVQSDFAHLLTVAIFYWGAVLYLGGPRPLVSTIPGGLLLLSLVFPEVSSAWGLIYQAWFSWALTVVSVGLLLTSRRHGDPLGCAHCVPSKSPGETFCLSCGRLIGRAETTLQRRRAAGFVAFSVLVIILLTPTVPLLNVSPSVAFVNYGLGGVQSSSPLPLPGWSQQPQVFSVQGQKFAGYMLTQGRESIEAYVTATTDPGLAGSVLDSARANSTHIIQAPRSIGQQMSAYSLTQGGTAYVDVQGVLSVGMLNGSQVVQTFAVVDLKQTAASFGADNGTSLYGAAKELTGWASSSALWSPFTSTMLSVSQQLSQWAYFVSISGVVVVIFTVARDDENAKVRRYESTFALSDSEAAVLSAFPAGSAWTTGVQVQGSVKYAISGVPDSDFYPALVSLSRRGLVRGSVLMRGGRPTLLWRSLL
jgi:hypothetical protein